MVGAELLSPNLILLLNEVINDQRIVKYLKYDVKNPLSNPTVALPATSLMFNRVFPFPFDLDPATADCSQLRIYYPVGLFKNNEVINDNTIYFDIIVAKSLWLTNDGGVAAVRPYEILAGIIKAFSDKTIGTLGVINFRRFLHIGINDKFQGIRLEAKVTAFGGSS